MLDDISFAAFAARIAKANPDLSEEQVDDYAALLGDIAPQKIPDSDLVIVRDYEKGGREVARIHLPDAA